LGKYDSDGENPNLSGEMKVKYYGQVTESYFLFRIFWCS